MKHKSRSSDQVGEFSAIHKFPNLELTPEMKSSVLEAGYGSHNPTEQQSSRDEFRRNSKDNILDWKSRLNQVEVQQIKKETLEVSELFYTENEW